MMLAQDLMTSAPATVRPTTTVRRAVEILETLEIRHLPVVDENRQLVGMLSDGICGRSRSRSSWETSTSAVFKQPSKLAFRAS
jgi:acetoin utilization protein AcuB